MKEWFSAAELADMRLPGLPVEKSGIIRRATRKIWVSRSRSGKGGGREYSVSSLPEEARLELARRATRELEPPPSSPGGRTPKANKDRPGLDTAIAALPEKTLTRMEAQAAVVRALKVFRKTSGLPKERALRIFAEAYRAGSIEVEAWVRAAVPKASRNSLRTWEQVLAEHGLAGLAPAYGNRKGMGLIDQDEAVRMYILGMIAEKPHVSATAVLEGLKARFPDKALMSLRNLQRWMDDWKTANAQLFEKVKNPDAWRSKYKSAFGSKSEGIIRLNQTWEMDSTPADLQLLDGSRHSLIGVIDVYSRRLRLHVSRTSCSAGVAAATRGAVIAWGAPEEVRIDNGSDYTSKHMYRVYDGLKIDVDLCPPFTPECKPHIERAFKTFSHGLLELLPGFVGHNVAERKEIEARKSFAQRMMTKGEIIEIRMTAEDLQAFCDRWCEDFYTHKPHSGLNDKTPFQAAAAWTGAVRRIENERALDVLLSETDNDGWRTVSKKGIRFDKATYGHAHLGGMEGQQVRVFYDDADFGHVYVFDEGGVFICKAMCPERVGVSRAEVAAAQKANQQRVNAEGMRKLKVAKKEARVDDVVLEILAAKAEAAGRLTAFPARTETYSTPALDQAARAVRAKPEAPRDLTSAEIRILQDLRAEAVAPAAPAAPTTPKDRYRKAVHLQAQLDAGRPIDAEDKRWLDGYRTTPEYRSHKDLHDTWGDAYFGGRAASA